MDFHEAVKSRYSCRDYQDRPVEPEKLDRIIEAARLAPSASNRQEWRFVAVTDPAKRTALTKIAHGQKFVGQAPLVIAACALTDGHVMSCGQLSYTIDVAIALEHIALAATVEGLATCWIGAFDEEPVKKLLGIPADVRVVQLMPLGYAADKRGPGTRMALRDILMHDEWSG
jgi:nitroreductase